MEWYTGTYFRNTKDGGGGGDDDDNEKTKVEVRN